MIKLIFSFVRICYCYNEAANLFFIDIFCFCKGISNMYKVFKNQRITSFFCKRTILGMVAQKMLCLHSKTVVVRICGWEPRYHEENIKVLKWIHFQVGNEWLTSNICLQWNQLPFPKQWRMVSSSRWGKLCFCSIWLYGRKILGQNQL